MQDTHHPVRGTNETREPQESSDPRRWKALAVVALALVAIGNGLLVGLSADGNVYLEALPGVTVFALGGGPLFVCATTSALGRVSLHEAPSAVSPCPRPVA